MSYWNYGIGQGEIDDETVLYVVSYHNRKRIPLTEALINDDRQEPTGGVWKHIEDMVARDLLEIRNGEVYTK